MKLTITQKPLIGFLGGPKELNIDININHQLYKIHISQYGQRLISVSSNANYEDILHIYYDVETLLMLFDGQFYPTVGANDGVDITQSWKKRTPFCYESADFLIGSNSKLIDFNLAINNNIVEKWSIIRQELDIIHNVVLYSTSNIEMPIDMKCAFMIEAFEGFCELVEVRDSNYTRPPIPHGCSKLKLYLLSVIDRYGLDIFSNEIQTDRDKFSSILVNSRNRIAHIKSKQGRAYLDGKESMEMIRKLFALYRVILFNLLGISRSLYDSYLKSYVSLIDNELTMNEFLSKLSDPSITA